MSHKLALTVPLHWRARCSQLRCSSGVGATIYNADAPPSSHRTDADRYDDIYHNGISGFGGNADRAEMADRSAFHCFVQKRRRFVQKTAFDGVAL
jgi:hypothetical protein